MEKKKQLAAILEEIKHPADGSRRAQCVCTWKTTMCCDVWKEAYRKAAQQTMKERLKQKEQLEKKGKAAMEDALARVPAAAHGEARLAKQGR